MSNDDVFEDLPFIISAGTPKADQATRTLIRSHVMRGKNREKPRGRRRNVLHSDRPQPKSSATNGTTWPLTIPRILCSELSSIRYADAVEPALIADILSFAPMFSKSMFLLDQCIVPETSGMVDRWFAPMLFDAAYLHAACFTIQAYLDGFFARTRSAEAHQIDRIHYAKAVKILQERLTLDDDCAKLWDSTIMTVLAFSGHAYTTGDYGSSNHHISGMLKLVNMRGVSSFFENTKLLVEIVRSDLSMSVDGGTTPMLFAHDNIPWSLMPAVDSARALHDVASSKQLREGLDTFPNTLDPKLADIWAAMSEFCALANEAAEKGQARITEEAFLHNMGSIMYRLLHQRFDVGSLDEAFRLGLLAFSSPIFLHWNRFESPDPRFTSAYRDALIELSTTDSNVTDRERLWLQMIGALTMSDEPESVAWIKPWLRISVQRCNVLTWNLMRDLLRSFLWVDVVYDNAGKIVFDSLL